MLLKSVDIYQQNYLVKVRPSTVAPYVIEKTKRNPWILLNPG